MSGIKADGILVKQYGESLLYGVSFAALLDASETLTGTPAVVEQTTSDLTISAVAVNTATFLDANGDTVAIGEGVQFRVGADGDNSNSGNSYWLDVQSGTSDSNTREVDVKLRIEG
jgi:hypothetical protein